MTEAGKLAGTADEGGWWPNFSSNEEALEMLTRAIERSGHKPGRDVFISLDIASSEFHRDGRYTLALDGRQLDADSMVALFASWARRFPILSIEDPGAEDDEGAMARTTGAIGASVQIVGDDYLVTDAERVRAGRASGACNCALIKVNQAAPSPRRARRWRRPAKPAGRRSSPHAPAKPKTCRSPSRRRLERRPDEVAPSPAPGAWRSRTN